MARPLPARVVLAYGLPGLVAALPIIPVAVLLPAFYARDVGLGLAATGIALAAARLLDFFSDALVGWSADRFGWRGYRYKPWLVLGMATAGAGLFQLAFPPDAAGSAWLWWWSVVLFTGWTALMVPYTAWGAELSADLHERSKLAASREIAGMLGMIVAVAAPLLFMADSADEGFALQTMAVIAAALGIPALLAMLVIVPEPAIEQGATRVRFRDLKRLLAFRPYRATLTCWFLNGLANGLPAVLFPVIVSDYFGLDQERLQWLLVGYFGAALLAAPLWIALARVAGKVRTWSGAIVVNMCVFAQVLWLGPADVQAYFVICVLSGATLGADLALPASLQADVMGADRRSNGVRRTGSAFALWSMATKLALALAVGVAFVTLDAFGGATTARGEVALFTLYVALPLLTKCVVLVLLRRIPALLDRVDRDATAQERKTAAEQRHVLV